MHAEIKKNRDDIEVNVFDSGAKKISQYNNKITKDPNIIAQILMDLEIMGFPITKAIAKYLERVRNKDWI